MARSGSSKPDDEVVEGERGGEASVFDVEDDIWDEASQPDALTEFSVGPPSPGRRRGSTTLRRRDEAREAQEDVPGSVHLARRETEDEPSEWRAPSLGAPRGGGAGRDAAWPSPGIATDLESLDLLAGTGVTGLIDQIIDEAVDDTEPRATHGARPLSLTDDLVLDAPGPAGAPGGAVSSRGTPPSDHEPAFAPPSGDRATAATAKPASLVDPSIEVRPVVDGPRAARSSVPERSRDAPTDLIDGEAVAVERAVAESVDTAVRPRPAGPAGGAASKSPAHVVVGQGEALGLPPDRPDPGAPSGLELDEPEGREPTHPRPVRVAEEPSDVALRPRWPRRVGWLVLVGLAALAAWGLVRMLA